MTTFYLIRHGQSQANEQKILNSDLPLSQKGITQAAALAVKLQSVPFDYFYASNHIRALQTAEILAKHQEKKVHVAAGLKERRWGVLDDVPLITVQKTYGSQLAHIMLIKQQERKSIKLLPSVESEEETTIRFVNSLQKIEKRHRGKTIALVSHGYALRLFLLYTGFIKDQDFFNTSLLNTGYIHLSSENGAYKILHVDKLIPTKRWY